MVREPKEKLCDRLEDGLVCPGGGENRWSSVLTVTKCNRHPRRVNQMDGDPRAKVGHPLKILPIISFPLD